MSELDKNIVRKEVEKGGPKGVLSGLIFGCPVCAHGRRVPKCPLRPIDCLHAEDKYHWFQRLSEERAAALVKKHSDCMGEFNNE